MHFTVCQPHRLLYTEVRNLSRRRLVIMAKARTARKETSTDGEFKRVESQFRNFISKGTQFEPESTNCLHLGLEDCIGLSITHPVWAKTRPGVDDHSGWQFCEPSDPPVTNPAGCGSFDCEGCIPDPINNARFVRDLYELSKDTGGKYSVPVLWDKKIKCIVNNESAEIVRMFNSEFNEFAKHPEFDLYPENLAKDIEEVNSWIYPTINNGVYRCGFAVKQGAYDIALQQLFESLDRCEDILSKQRYIAGDVFTEADVRLFCTLIRFDEVYVVYFKTNKKAIREYPHLSNYVRELYQIPEIQRAVNMKHIKNHYFASHPPLNVYAIVPTGGGPWWEHAHNRDTLFPKKH